MTEKFAGIFPYLLPVLGCILISTAAFVMYVPLGLLVSGIGTFFMEWRIDAERSRR